jgi:hypothetical protein
MNRCLGGWAGNSPNPDPMGSYFKAQERFEQERLASGLDMLASGRKPQTAFEQDNLRTAERHTGRFQESIFPTHDFVMETFKSKPDPIIPAPMKFEVPKPILPEPIKIEPIKVDLPKYEPLKFEMPKIEPIIPTYIQTTPLGSTELGADRFHLCKYPDSHVGDYSQTFWQKDLVTGKRKDYGQSDFTLGSGFKLKDSVF